ncbi:uncharacterized protein SPSK_04586 [Sporothrix schenckii 1099-18]|uniref:Uncharacterized protein n=1 Tax=Sporothrix schenckii 1099-18 TaxID=1397361 RepID=A0A0F2M484_SPOSC|nr:uncharacterized protein SPSK_04586 [Sporothrix schenckii 1099-18]KJR82976.1 hypothetical protein SPSK_04586 [Sporothrix schenckii 1099-18]
MRPKGRPPLVCDHPPPTEFKKKNKDSTQTAGKSGAVVPSEAFDSHCGDVLEIPENCYRPVNNARGDTAASGRTAGTEIVRLCTPYISNPMRSSAVPKHPVKPAGQAAKGRCFRDIFQFSPSRVYAAGEFLKSRGDTQEDKKGSTD